MYNRGHDASRPSLQGQSTSTSTTSLYQPEYQAPPSAFPVNMSAEQNSMTGTGAALSKTSSPLSNATGPAAVAEGEEPLEADDMGLQMRTRQPGAPSTNAALTASVAGVEKRRNQPSPLADSTPTKASVAAEVATPIPVKKSKKELAKEAKEAKEKRKAEEKQKAVEASRAKAEAAREKKKREDAEKAKRETEKKAAKLKAKLEKEQAKSNKKLASNGKPAPPALAMPATPLKGRTKDLSAATPTSFPATPATPAEPARLLDVAPSSEQSLNTPTKPLPLSKQAILGAKEQQDRLTTASNATQTPRREASTSVPAQSPAVSSVKSKRSLFGTLRKKFSSGPSPASSRAQSAGREGQSTPVLAPSGPASLLSTPPKETVEDTASASIPRQPPAAVPEDTSAVLGESTQEPSHTPPSTDNQTVNALVAEPVATPSHMTTAVTNGSTLSTVENAVDPLANSISSSEQTEDTAPGTSSTSNESAETKGDVVIRANNAREGELNVDLHVKYIQELDTVRNFPYPLPSFADSVSVIFFVEN